MNKVSGGIEEGDEALYWFDVLVEAEVARRETVHELRDENDQLLRILVASRSTAKARIRQQQSKKAERA